MAFDEAWEHIRRHPRDLDARRVLADAFLAEGHEQGELLRLCQLPKAERAKVKPRVVELLNANLERWYPRPRWYDPRWSWCHPDTLLETGGVPDAISLPANVDDLKWWLERYPLRQLWMSSSATPEALALLIEGGHFARLEHVILDAQHSPSALPRFLADAGPGLLELHVTSTVDAGRTLVPGRWLSELRSLAISLREPSVLALLWPSLEQLESLSVSSYGLNETPLPALAVKKLKSAALKIQSNAGRTNAAFARQFLTCFEPAVLEELSVMGCDLEVDDLSGVTANFPALQRLTLSSNDLRRLPELLRRKLPKLELLDVSSNKLGAAALEELMQQPYAARLKKLGVVRNDIITGSEPVYDYGVEVASTPIEATAAELRAMLSIPSTVDVF